MAWRQSDAECITPHIRRSAIPLNASPHNAQRTVWQYAVSAHRRDEPTEPKLAAP